MTTTIQTSESKTENGLIIWPNTNVYRTRPALMAALKELHRQRGGTILSTVILIKG